jgi:hypothetical protein
MGPKVTLFGACISCMRCTQDVHKVVITIPRTSYVNVTCGIQTTFPDIFAGFMWGLCKFSSMYWDAWIFRTCNTRSSYDNPANISNGCYCVGSFVCYGWWTVISVSAVCKQHSKLSFANGPTPRFYSYSKHPILVLYKQLCYTSNNKNDPNQAKNEATKCLDFFLAFSVFVLSFSR